MLIPKEDLPNTWFGTQFLFSERSVPFAIFSWWRRKSG